MLAPIDKLEGKGNGNRYMQIEITTACNLSCSNCTRLLPFRTDFKHMSVECFRMAIESVVGWAEAGGVVAIFGGNPPAHPQFEKLMDVYCALIPNQASRGLWASNLLKHGELIRRVFYPDATFNLNAHADRKAAQEIDLWLPGKLIRSSRDQRALHGPILMDRRELVPPMDEIEWAAARENCDINRNWSGIIVERGGYPYGYFCEIASSLDGVRGENHGVLATPDWWKTRMDAPAFDEQVRQCCDRGCGVPLRMRGHYDDEAVYDVTKTWQDVLMPHEKAFRQVGLQLHEAAPKPEQKVVELTDYMNLRKGKVSRR